MANEAIVIAYDELVKHQAPDMLGGISAFGFVGPKGEPMALLNEACHAALGRPGYAPKAVYTWFKSHKEFRDLNIKFINFLLDPKVSPYREILEANPPVQAKPFTKAINTPEFGYQHGYILYNLAIPGNLLGNFCIASRWVYEHKPEVELWDKLVEHGVQPAVALFISANFASNKDGGNKYQFRGYDAGHHALNLFAVGMDYFENFCHGKTANRLPDYNKQQNYIPCNTVWGQNVAGYDLRGVKIKTPPGTQKYKDYLTKKYLKVKETSSSFGVTVEIHELLTLKHIVEIAQEEQQRIGL